MTAKEMRQFMQIPDNPKEGVLMMSDKFFYEFCEQLCREQREICLKNVLEKKENLIHDILTAPMPKL